MSKNRAGVPTWMVKYGVGPGDWLSATKKGLEVFMRPGWPLKLRMSIGLVLHASGYRNELAIQQVKSDSKHDPPKFVALTPGTLLGRLYRVAIEAFHESGNPLNDDQREALKVSFPHARAALEELEREDGIITRVRANCETKKLLGLSLDEAIAKGLVTPISELSAKDRKKLTNRSFIYVHLRPRPATKEALMRRVDEQVLATGRNDQLEKALGAPVQLFFKFLRAEGVADAHLAAELGNSDRGQAIYAEVLDAKEKLKTAEQKAREFALSKIDKKPAKAVEPPPATEQPTLFPKRPKTMEELQPIVAMMERWNDVSARDRWSGPPISISEKFVKQLFAACRDARPDCTPEEVAAGVAEKLRIKKHSELNNPYGYLNKAVPDWFETDAFDRYRKEQAAFDALESKRNAPLPTPELPAEDPLCEWARVKEHLREGLSAQEFANWIDATRQVSYDGETLIVRVLDSVTCEWIQREYAAQLPAAIADAGIEGTVRFEVAEQARRAS